tara:strand:+ start:767 stop:1744 length:978 start_codon:yes stop_codon:yes gene_type:complete
MILIVGGAGYIGSHITKKLYELGYDVVVFDNFSTGHRSFIQWGSQFEGDLRNKDDLNNCFKKYAITAVIHTAALSIVPDSLKNPQSYYENNVIGTFNLLTVMRLYNVNTFIFSSTCAVYGEVEIQPISEETPCNPITPYGQTKRMIELMLHDFHSAYGLNYISLRYFNAIGADPEGTIGESHHPETHLVPLCFMAIECNQPLTVYGTDYDTPDGTCIRDYCHVNDIAMAHILSLNHLQLKKSSGCYNLGIGQGYSVKQVITTIEKVTGNKVPIQWGDRRCGDVARLEAKPDKIYTTFNWKPEYTNLEKSIQTAWNWFSHHEKKIL